MGGTQISGETHITATADLGFEKGGLFFPLSQTTPTSKTTPILKATPLNINLMDSITEMAMNSIMME